MTRRETVDVGGVPISYLTAGKGGPLILLLHGTYWSRVWQPVLQGIAAAGLRPVAVDFPARALGHNCFQCGRGLFEGDTRTGRIAAQLAARGFGCRGNLLPRRFLNPAAFFFGCGPDALFFGSRFFLRECPHVADFVVEMREPALHRRAIALGVGEVATRLHETEVAAAEREPLAGARPRRSRRTRLLRGLIHLIRRRHRHVARGRAPRARISRELA